MSDFWKEWVRVLSRELLLIFLIVYFHVTGASEVLQGSLVAGLLAMMNTTRFQWSSKKPGDNDEREKSNPPQEKPAGNE